jgi:predicted metal-dependent hydrolase
MTALDSPSKTMPGAAPAPVSVTPRDLRFSTGDARGRAWLGGDPVGTAVFNALSLTFPEGERSFMDSVRAHRHLLSGRLLDEAKAFIAQEAIHSREHVALNSLLDRSHYPVDAIEAEIRRRVGVMRERGPLAMLSVTIALEHFTAMLADTFLRDETLFAGAPPEVARLWQWHSLEETEHKAVAFDVFLEVTRDMTPRQRHRIRARVMRIVTILFVRNIAHYAAQLLEADGMNPWTAHARVLWYLFGRPGLFRRAWRAYADWYRPDFHPWNHDNRALLDQWRRVFETPAEPRAA